MPLFGKLIVSTGGQSPLGDLFPIRSVLLLIDSIEQSEDLDMDLTTAKGCWSTARQTQWGNSLPVPHQPQPTQPYYQTPCICQCDRHSAREGVQYNLPNSVPSSDRFVYTSDNLVLQPGVYNIFTCMEVVFEYMQVASTKGECTASKVSFALLVRENSTFTYFHIYDPCRTGTQILGLYCFSQP